jgi:hypothetical protein
MGRVGKRHAKVLGLAARIATREVRIPEQARRRVAEGRVAELLVAVRALADGEIAALTLLALAANDRERHHDAVANFQLLVLGADLDHFAHALVAQMSPLFIAGM